MNNKKIIMIGLIAIALLTAALLMVINVNFFKEMFPVLPEPMEKTAVEEVPELNYAIPSTAIPADQSTETTITGTIEKRQALEEQEIEADHARTARRAEAFARLKEAEKALLSTAPTDSKQTAVVSPPQEEYKLPTDEEIKKMESEGIISY